MSSNQRLQRLDGPSTLFFAQGRDVISELSSKTAPLTIHGRGHVWKSQPH